MSVAADLSAGAGMSVPGPRRATSEELERLERRRWQLWAVAGVILVAISVAVVVALTGSDAPDLVGRTPMLRYGFLAVSLAFLLYVFDQERSLRSLTRALFDEHERATTLEGRVRDLRTLVGSARTVNSVLAAEEVYRVVLEAALELSEADTGAVLLRVGDVLTVAVSRGAQAPPAGAHVPVGAGPIGRVAEGGDVELTGDGPTGVCAPIIVRGRRVGVLAIQRTEGQAPFGDRDVSTVRLFAEQAASAVANANRFEQERARVAALVDAAEQRTEFVARLVHDLRAPLSAVNGYAQLVRDRDERLSGPQRRQALDSIVEQAARLGRMIDEVLSSTSVEAGASLRRDPVDLAAVLKATVETARAVVIGRQDDRSIELVDADTAGVVAGDPEALRHVFLNLVENAAKYSPEGAPIVVRVEDRADEVAVHVVDRGAGIPSDQLPHVFERFRQSSGGRGGVGLGLYIVRTLVQAHRGTVEVRSEEGSGSVFSVTLPRA